MGRPPCLPSLQYILLTNSLLFSLIVCLLIEQNSVMMTNKSLRKARPFSDSVLVDRTTGFVLIRSILEQSIGNIETILTTAHGQRKKM